MELNPELTDKTFKGLLARLFRKLAFERTGGHITTYSRFIDAFILGQKYSTNSKSLRNASARGNLKQELNSPKMSFSVFCKACLLLQYKSIKITISAETFSGLTDVVEETVILRNIDPETFNEESKK